MSKRLSIMDLTNELLRTEQYVNNGTLIVVYNKTKRQVCETIDFFEVVYNGPDLYLNYSIEGTDLTYNDHINLTSVNNINGVPIFPIN